MVKDELVYLACPFDHMDVGIREKRLEMASKFAANLMRQGILVFCPLSHNIALLRYGLPLGWDYWEKFDKIFLKRCDKLCVLKLEGWEKSVGVQAEVRLAREYDIPIEYIDYNISSCVN